MRKQRWKIGLILKTLLFHRAALQQSVAAWFRSQSLPTTQTLHLLKAPSSPGLRARQTAFQESRPTMKGRVHLSVNSFAGSAVSKPRSCYWVPETLHSTKPHGDLSASYSSARYWVSLSRGWSSSRTKSKPAVLPRLGGFLAARLYCSVALSLIDLQCFVKLEDWRSLIPLFESQGQDSSI